MRGVRQGTRCSNGGADEEEEGAKSSEGPVLHRERGPGKYRVVKAEAKPAFVFVIRWRAVHGIPPDPKDSVSAPAAFRNGRAADADAWHPRWG